MPIRIQCQACGAALKASEELVGQSLPCPKCQQPISVSLASADDPDEDIQLEIIEPGEEQSGALLGQSPTGLGAGPNNPHPDQGFAQGGTQLGGFAESSQPSGFAQPGFQQHGHQPWQMQDDPHGGFGGGGFGGGGFGGVQAPRRPRRKRSKEQRLETSRKVGACAIFYGLVAIVILLIATDFEPPIKSPLNTALFASFATAGLGGFCLVYGSSAIKNKFMYNSAKSALVTGITKIEGDTAVFFGTFYVGIGWFLIMFASPISLFIAYTLWR